MKKSHIIFALLLVASLMGCSKTSSDPEATTQTTVASETTIPTAQASPLPTQPEEPTESVTEETSPDSTEETPSSPTKETTAPVKETKPTVSISSRDANFVRVADYIPSATIELKYASTDNFTEQSIYEFQDAYLRYGTIKKLMKVSDELSKQGLRLKIWDAFRPTSAQYTLWDIYPDGNFVSNPNTGFSSHSRGGTVDITLVDAQGKELEMPSEYDDFSSLADRDYSDCNKTAAKNARLLQEVMEKHGFSGYRKEWWHFADTTQYPVDECFDPAAVSQWYADCKEYISLRTEPSKTAPVITRIPVNEEMTLLGWTGDFALVDYHGDQGYVLASYIEPVGQTVSVDRAKTMELKFYPGTKPEILSLTLYLGKGYSIYIPNEGWRLEQMSYPNKYPSFEDVWVSTINDDAYIKVGYFPDKSPKAVRSLIVDQEKDYHLAETKQGGLLGKSDDEKKLLEVFMDDVKNGTFVVSYHYPVAASEKFGSRLSVIADTFMVSE